MKIEEAIGDLKYYIEEDPYFNGTYEPVTDFEKYCYNHCKAIDTLINYVETMHSEFDRLEGIEDNTSMLKQELEEQTEANKELNKVLIHFKAMINEMADYIAELDVDEDICKNIEHCASDKKLCRECIKEYFYKKVSDNK